MELLLTILSVLAFWAFLLVLVVGLLLILKPLDNVRSSLEKIAMGVRAIERETQPIGGDAEQLAASLRAAVETAAPAVERLTQAERNLDAALGP